MKEKVSMFIFGNVLANQIIIARGGVYEIYSDPEEYDLSDAVVLHGDVSLGVVHVNGIACTGEIAETGGANG